jgi:hypothetical protein
MARNPLATVIDLREGPGDGIRVPIEPRNKHVYYQGERYFRMDNVTHQPAGEPLGQCYLWDNYWTERLKGK